MVLIVFKSKKNNNKDPFNMRKHIPGAVNLAKNQWLFSSQAQGVNLLLIFCKMDIILI